MNTLPLPKPRHLSFLGGLFFSVIFLSSFPLSSVLAQEEQQIQTLSTFYGKPAIEAEAEGVKFKFYQQGPYKIIAVVPRGTEAPAFLSYTKTDAAFTAEDTGDFLSSFAHTLNGGWVLLDQAMFEASLRFFIDAPNGDPEMFKWRIKKTGRDPEKVEAAWRKLSSNPEARAEAEAVIKMLKSQRRVWVSSDGRFLATWSGDGKSIGVGMMPPRVPFGANTVR